VRGYVVALATERCRIVKLEEPPLEQVSYLMIQVSNVLPFFAPARSRAGGDLTATERARRPIYFAAVPIFSLLRQRPFATL
jgi:hypothetical protein